MRELEWGSIIILKIFIFPEHQLKEKYTDSPEKRVVEMGVGDWGLKFQGQLIARKSALLRFFFFQRMALVNEVL